MRIMLTKKVVKRCFELADKFMSVVPRLKRGKKILLGDLGARRPVDVYGCGPGVTNFEFGVYRPSEDCIYIATPGFLGIKRDANKHCPRGSSRHFKDNIVKMFLAKGIAHEAAHATDPRRKDQWYDKTYNYDSRLLDAYYCHPIEVEAELAAARHVVMPYVFSMGKDVSSRRLFNAIMDTTGYRLKWKSRPACMRKLEEEVNDFTMPYWNDMQELPNIIGKAERDVRDLTCREKAIVKRLWREIDERHALYDSRKTRRSSR